MRYPSEMLGYLLLCSKTKRTVINTVLISQLENQKLLFFLYTTTARPARATAAITAT